MISFYAKENSDVEDFFAEIFDIFCRVGSLNNELKDFIKDVLNDVSF